MSASYHFKTEQKIQNTDHISICTYDFFNERIDRTKQNRTKAIQPEITQLIAILGDFIANQDNEKKEIDLSV